MKAVTRLTNSQRNRLLAVHQIEVREFLAGRDAAERLDFLVGFLADNIDDIVDGDDADEPLSRIDDRR